MRIGDTITVELKVIEKLPAKKQLRLQTTARNQNGKTVVSGLATVLPPTQKVMIERPPEPQFTPA